MEPTHNGVAKLPNIIYPVAASEKERIAAVLAQKSVAAASCEIF